jgi:hypothetical protein
MFDQKQHDCHHPSTLLFSVPLSKIKVKGPKFDTIEVMEAESQAVLSIFTEHDFQDAFRNDRSARDGAYAPRITL